MADQTLKIFATKLPLDWTDDQVKEYFSAQGSVLEVSVFKDSGKSKLSSGLGCAYIKFQNKAEAEEIMRKLNKEVGAN
jgi:RNA recognition motif-containing protein